MSGQAIFCTFFNCLQIKAAKNSFTILFRGTDMKGAIIERIVVFAPWQKNGHVWLWTELNWTLAQFHLTRNCKKIEKWEEFARNFLSFFSTLKKKN